MSIRILVFEELSIVYSGSLWVVLILNVMCIIHLKMYIWNNI